jgi:hypothetical protein
MSRKPKTPRKETFGLRHHPLIEAIVGLVITILVEIANGLFFEGSNAVHALALAVSIGGVLLTVQRHSLERSFEDRLGPLNSVAAYVDVSQEANYEVLRGLLQSYSGVIENEFRAVKEQIVKNAGEELRHLAFEKTSPVLSTIDYYEWIFRQLRPSAAQSYVHMVSLCNEGEWDNSALEKNFFDAYVEASERLDVKTIFVVPESQLSSLLARPAVDAHTVEATNRLQGFWVSLDEVKDKHSHLLPLLSGGFMDFDGRVGLEDNHESSGALRGQVTMRAGDCERFNDLFEKLLRLSTKLTRATPPEPAL